MNDFVIKKATRQGVKPLVGIYGESGTGKSYSALLLARGLVGPTGRIVVADTESGRGELYSDVLPGGYEVVPFGSPFSPERYIAVVESIEKSGAGVGIIDSASHEWEGIGGVLDMASQNEEKSGKPGLHCWKGPKMAHARFMLKLLQSPIPWIVCLRAKHKSRQVKENGRTAIIKDDFTTPIQADDYIFELLVHGEVMQDHSFRLTKSNHPDLAKCFPTSGPITIAHGEALARWCASPGKSPEPSTAPGKDPLKAKLWALAKKYVGDGNSPAEIEAALTAKKIITRPLKELGTSEIGEAIDRLEVEMSDLIP